MLIPPSLIHPPNFELFILCFGRENNLKSYYIRKRLNIKACNWRFCYLGQRQTTLTPVLEKELPRHLNFCCQTNFLKFHRRDFSRFIIRIRFLKYNTELTNRLSPWQKNKNTKNNIDCIFTLTRWQQQFCCSCKESRRAGCW